MPDQLRAPIPERRSRFEGEMIRSVRTTTCSGFSNPVSSASLKASTIILILWGVKVNLTQSSAIPGTSSGRSPQTHICSYFLRWSAIVLVIPEKGGSGVFVSSTEVKATYLLVACGRSSSSWVLVWTAIVWPEGRMTLPLPLLERTIAIYLGRR